MAKDAYHHGDLRAGLLRAGREILAQEGLAALTLRAAARAAGVSHAAPYRHFADGEALLAALATEGFDELHRILLAARDAARDRDDGDRLGTLSAAYVGYAVAQPAMYRLMFGPAIASKSAHRELMATAARAYGVLADAVADRVGRPPAEGRGLRALTLGAWSLVHGLAQLYVEGQIVDAPETRSPEALARTIAACYAAGLDAPPGKALPGEILP